MHVNGGRGYVHVPAPDGWLLGREVFLEVLAQPLEPFELVLVLRRINLESLGDVGVDDRNALYDHPQQARLVRVFPIIEPIEDRIGRSTSQNSDSIVRLHPAERQVIAGRREGERREILILDLGYLQTEYVGPVAFKPLQHDGEAFAQRVHIEGGNLHLMTNCS